MVILAVTNLSYQKKLMSILSSESLKYATS
jgi:hypothetical protein